MGIEQNERTTPPRGRKTSGIPWQKDPPKNNEERLQRKVNFYKWACGIVAAIFGAGFMLAREVGAFATKDGVKSSLTERITDHDKTHKTIDEKFEKLDDRTMKIYGEQRAAAARQELVQANIELLVESAEQSEPARPVERATRRRMRAEIVKKKERLREIEADPLQGLDDL